jgi:hypothetical protein
MSAYNFKDLRKLENRWASFKDWPGMRGEVNELVLSGFFYTGQRTRVMCPYCGGVITAWSERDEPLFLHSMLWPNCSFIRSLPKIKYPRILQLQ